MPAMTSLLAASAAIGGAASLYGAHQQSEAIKSKADFDRQQAGTNAQLADIQADDAIRRGDIEAKRALRAGRALEGEQRAALAAQGIDINSGSAGAILDETSSMAHEDYETIKNNAWREAWGFKSQAAESRGAGKLAQVAGQNKARNTLLMGGIGALTQFGQAGAYAAKGAGARKPAATNYDMPSADDFDDPEFGSSLKKPSRYRLR